MTLRPPDVASGPPQSVVKLLKLLDGRVDGAEGIERQRIFKALAALFSNVGATGETVALFDDLFMRLCEDAETATLVPLAEALAQAAAAPPIMSRKLAWHEDAAVAAPILANSPALISDDLVTLAGRVGPDHLHAICARANIGTALSAIIIARDYTTATQRLLSNPGATFTIPDFRVAVSRAVSDSRGRVELRQPVDILDFARRRSGRCMTRDISPGGIKIELSGGGRPPDSFMLELPGVENVRLTCRYVWHRDSMVGAVLQEPLFDQLAAQQAR